MWTLKHEISSPKFYKLLTKTELKGYTTMDLKNFFNHINMCLNAVIRLKEDLLPDYQSIKIHFHFKEYFVPDRDHPSHSWNVQIYTYLGNSPLVAMPNDTCVNPPWHLKLTKLSALMLMRYQDRLYSPYLSIHVLLTLEGQMMMLNLIYLPWPSRM